LRAIELSGMPLDTLRQGFRAFSGRLTLAQRDDGKWTLSYCTGQYYPTEYRAAVCAVSAAALWDYYRDDFAHDPHKPERSPGDSIRMNFCRLFGRTMQQRWFD
jgi:hypothetical protein